MKSEQLGARELKFISEGSLLVRIISSPQQQKHKLSKQELNKV